MFQLKDILQLKNTPQQKKTVLQSKEPVYYMWVQCVAMFTFAQVGTDIYSKRAIFHRRTADTHIYNVYSMYRENLFI